MVSLGTTDKRRVLEMEKEKLTRDLVHLTSLVLSVTKGEKSPGELIDEPFGQGPVGWAKVRHLGRHLADLLEMRGPPVFLVSMPRSGSSWIGEMLGSSPDAAYLREPITQSCIAKGVFGQGRTVTCYVDPAAPPKIYERVARDAFSGLPNFPPDIVPMPGQWPLRERSKRRLIIKEVNPLCLQWVIDAFRPKILLLLRHPVAVARSRHRLGWGALGLEQKHAFPPKLFARYPEAKRILATANDFWEKEGARQGLITRYAIDTLAGYKDGKTISYEEFCRNPLESFEKLYDFCGLTMTADARRRIEDHSESGDPSKPFSKHRDSRAMEFAWKKGIDPDTIRKVSDFYGEFGLEFYRASCPPSSCRC